MKQVIVIRKDLKMRKGKMIAQGAHASMAVFFNRKEESEYADELLIKVDPIEFKWINGTFTKICVSVNSEQELVKIYEKAVLAKIPSAIITDVGKTEFHNEPTLTACAIGPADNDLIDTITGELPLL